MNNKFENVLIIGVGLIGSSLARGLRKYEVANNIFGLDKSKSVVSRCKKLKILDDIKIDLLDLEHLEANISLLNSSGPSFIFRDIIVSEDEEEFNIPDTSLINNSDDFIFAVSSVGLDNLIVSKV